MEYFNILLCFLFNLKYSLTDGLVAYWPIENNVYDVIGDANMIGPFVGTGGSVSLTNDRFGNASSAINFNNGYYMVPSGVYFYENFTIAVWLKINNALKFEPILDFGNVAKDNNVWVSPINTNRLNYPFIAMYYPQIGNTNYYSCTGTTQVVLNSWFLFVLTLSGATAKLYLNGTLTDTFTGFYTPKSTLRDMNFIGADNFNDYFLQADLDDLRIYNRSLTQEEIYLLLGMTLTSTTTTSTTTTSTTTKTSTTTTRTSTTSTSRTTTTTLATTSTTSTRTSTTAPAITSTTSTTTRTSTTSTTTPITTSSTSTSTTTTQPPATTPTAHGCRAMAARSRF